jgi:ABC-type multidrug transport system permease subunit
MLSGVFQWLHSWVPLRFIADGYRAIIFFHGRVDAGLNTAVLALALDVILFTALAAGISARRDRRRKALLAQIPEPVAAH